jgi:hypothetical protein
MPLRFPPRSFYGATIIDANSLDSRPYVDDYPCDAASVRRRSIAAILLRGIRRCIVADRELNDDQSKISAQDEPVLGNLGDSLPEPLDFVSDKPLSVSHVSKTPGFGDDRNTQLNKGNQTPFDPPVIPTGRRLKTSACSRFWPLFSRCFAKFSPLKLSPSRCLSDQRRESSWVLFLPFRTRLSGLSKSLDPGVMEITPNP